MTWHSKDRCPSRDELFLFESRDLSPRRAAIVKQHLEDCRACNDHVLELTTVFATFRELASKASERRQDSWAGFDRALRAETAAWRAQHQRFRRVGRSLAAIAAALLVAIVWYNQMEVPLNAEAVLANSFAYEQREPRQSQTPVAIRLKSAPNPTRAGLVGRGGTPTASVSKHNTRWQFLASSSPVAQQLASRLAPFGFGWSSPLSVKHFLAWRRTIPSPKDVLSSVNPSLIKVSTAAGANADIVYAEITVRSDTYQPVSQFWKWADGLEMELALESAGLHHIDSEPHIVSSYPGSEPVSEIRVSPDLEQVELDLRVAMQQLGLNVGQDLSITSRGRTILLAGTVGTRALAARVIAYGRTHQGIKTNIRIGAGSPTGDLPLSTGMEAWLKNVLRDEELSRTFVPRTFDLIEELQGRVIALSSLATRYPLDSSENRPTPFQVSINRLAGAQYADIMSSFEALERHLAPLVGTITRPLSQDHLPDHWRTSGQLLHAEVPLLRSAIDEVIGTGHFETAHDLDETARRILRPALERVATISSPEIP